MAACSILDIATGAGLLPHIYCKKVTLENGANSDSVNVTLNLELLQSKNDLTKSTWLNNLQIGDKNILDYMYIQIVPFKDSDNINKLKPDFDATNANEPGNVYTVSGHPKFKELLGSNISYFPVGWPAANAPQAPSSMGAGEGKTYDYESWWGDLTDIPSPMQISTKSLLGNIAGADLLPTLEGGQIFSREEIIDGKPYYAVPFDYKHTLNHTPNNLGFLIYPFLNMPQFLQELESLNTLDLDVNMLTGPVTTEIVFENNAMAETRRQFYLPDGKAWNGAAHLHVCGLNEDPTGYCGDGGLGTASGTGYRGWMAGERHVNKAPRLRLMEAANYKIQDFRRRGFEAPEELTDSDPDSPTYNAKQVLAYGTQKNVFNQNKEVLGQIENIISPFQKETKKYLTKIDASNGTGFMYSPYDNDSEYSKLYISRDKDNSASAFFMINFESLLKNNSLLFGNLASHETVTNSCLGLSRLIELKIYRDRVKKKPVGKTYEKYANDTSYEEPSFLVGTIKDAGSYGDNFGAVEATGELRELQIHLGAPNPGIGPTGKIRFFTFKDTDAGSSTAGLYQYRVEALFEDGTFAYLNNVLVDLTKARTILQDYYDFSLSSFNKGENEISVASALIGDIKANQEKHYKTFNTPYFQNGSFVQEFESAAKTRFSGLEDAGGEFAFPWAGGSLQVPTVLGMLKNIIAVIFELDAPPPSDNSISTMISPVTGTPRGIEFLIRYADTIIDHLHGLVGSTEVAKSGSELNNAATTAPHGYNFNNFFDFVVSPSEALIQEYHTFDHPSEIHRAVSNEDIYIDYLSSGATSPLPTANGLFTISRTDYRARCQLDAKRLSPLATSPALGSDPTQPDQAKINPAGQAEDYLSSTGYSYLMPSILELSDPTDEDDTFLFKINHFQSGEINLDGKAFEDYDKVLIALTTYGRNKIEVDDADLLPDYYRAHNISLPGFEVPSFVVSKVEEREYYKNLFNMDGVTVHSSDKYDDFFAKTPGAQGAPVGDPGSNTAPSLNELVPVFPDDFSDSDIATEQYYKKLFYSDKTYTPVGAAGYGDAYHKDLPNIYKLIILDTSGAAPEKINLIFKMALNLSVTNPQTTNSYFFINSNLISEIQVYTGPTTANMKNDEDGWQTLTNESLNVLTSPVYVTLNKSLFCRAVLYKDDSAQGVRLPILNKYFLITP